MTIEAYAITTGNRKYNILLMVCLIAVGWMGNYFKFPIFLNIDFLFGSIFALLVLQLFGISRGVVAAAVISSYTYLLWNEPYAFIIMTAEVATVGYLMARRKIGMVLADGIYWLFIGLPLGYFLYRFALDIATTSLRIIMIKQAMNGIANALVARLIFTGYLLYSRSKLISYKEIIYNLLTFFVLCPALVILAIASRSDFNETDQQIRATLNRDSGRLSLRLKTWVLNRKSAIINLAEMATTRSPQQMQPYLDLVKKSDVSFIRVLLIDKKATSIAGSPHIDELGQISTGINYADHNYLKTLKQELRPMLSETLIDRVGTPKAVVMVIAPLVIHGKFGGHITGILTLKQIQEHLDKSASENSLLYTLVDKNGNVIMSNRADQKVMALFTRGKGTLQQLDKGISQWIPTLPPNTSISERWRNSFYVSETPIGDLAEWRLILEQPVAPFQKRLYDNYTGRLTMLFIILLGALALAELLSRKIVVTLRQLRTLTYELPVRLATDGKEIVWPDSGIAEANHLINNFREMADSLTDQFTEVRQINETLEERVKERTEEVDRLANEQRIVLSAMPIGVCFLKGQKIQFANPAFDLIFGYETGATKGMDTSEFYADLETYQRMRKEKHELITSSKIDTIEAEMKKKDGSPVLCSIVVQAVDAEKQELGLIWIIQDITERRKLEEERRKFDLQMLQAQKLESLGVLAGGIAHDFNNILMAIMGNTDLALVRVGPESPAVDNLKRIEQSAARAAELAKLMLAYSGKGKFIIEQLDINRLVKEVLQIIEPSISKKIELRLNLTTPIPSVEGDGSQLEQIIKNLVINASEAIDENAGVIAISTASIECDREQLSSIWLDEELTPGQYVSLEVSDTGCGMDKDTIARLFDPFFSTKFTGRGLGMPAVLGIVRGHKGTIKIQSEPGKGSSFRILFPTVIAG